MIGRRVAVGLRALDLRDVCGDLTRGPPCFSRHPAVACDALALASELGLKLEAGRRREEKGDARADRGANDEDPRRGERGRREARAARETQGREDRIRREVADLEKPCGVVGASLAR